MTGATACRDDNNDEFTYTIEKESPSFNNIVVEPTTTTNGALISSTGQYISYPLTGLDLAGKTITIELSNTPTASI